MSNSALLSEFFQFLEDIPFGQVAATIASGGTNIAIDVATAEAVVAAAVKDFFSGAPASASSVATATPTVAAATGASPAS